MVFRRPNSSNYHSKKQLPADLWREKARLEEMGLKPFKVVTKSLRTSDKKEALRRQAQFYSECESLWDKWRAMLEGGVQSLDGPQEWAMVTAVTESLLQRHSTSSASPAEWFKPGTRGNWRKLLGLDDEGKIIGAIFAAIDAVALQRGLVLTPESRLAVGNKLVGYDEATAQEALTTGTPPEWPSQGDLTLASQSLAWRAATGDYSPPQFLQGRPSLKPGGNASGLTFESLVDNWQTFGRGNNLPAVASVRKYRENAFSFKTFIGHNGPSQVTVADAQRYLEHISRGDDSNAKPAEKHVRDIILNLSTLYRKAIKAEKLTSNPFASIVPSKARRSLKAQRRGFTNEEAAIVLQATRRETDSFRRWGPWIMAYSGMRLTEASQLRKVDIEVEGDQAFIHIRPEAGHVKSHTERVIPVHKALANEGFLQFADSIKGERLFPHVCLDKAGNRLNEQGAPNDSKAHKLSEWVWTTGIQHDSRLSPNHGWRHRFQREGVNARLDQRAIDRIIGHTEGHVRETYQQDGFKKFLTEEMAKLPAIQVPNIENEGKE